MFRKATAILLTFFLLWGNTGFSLNVHYCKTSESVSLMLNRIIGERCGKDAAHDMPAKEDASHPDKSCCKKLQQTLPSAKKNCCSDTQVEVKITDAFQGTFLQLDLQKHWHKTVYIPFTAYFPQYVALPAATASVLSDPPDIPPAMLYGGKDLLIENSVFRI